MANQFQGGEIWADGQTVNAARLNNTVNLATAQPGLITEQGLVTPVPADQILLQQASSGLLKRATIESVTSSGLFSAGGWNPPDPAQTTATGAGVMMGLGATAHITPNVTGKLLVIMSGWMFNNTTGQFAIGYMRYGTGAAPANGDTPSGSIMGNVVRISPVFLSNTGYNFSMTGILIGLGTGNLYWIDMALAASGSGSSAGIQYINITAVELP